MKESGNFYQTSSGLASSHVRTGGLAGHSAEGSSCFRQMPISRISVTFSQKSMAAYEVMRPTSLSALFPSVTADLSDAWVSFQASNPLVAYGSVIDNLSTDPTFVPHQQDISDED